ncbi:isopentenyl-diphosphate delta-isomerase [Ignicoccus islandicus DSM 13165]|uniref:Isopentenyl-diphosphate delta-isomerase n=1 Tax=Ignicoccus islandicus DSM 13165 TaxID=940295 RepID=A0A0U2U603_9CREN|nr:type 2 isopentenyl-diphosphate Delta-isomerase [Ignicoccus islandicus]ALU11588.1 isopentenyl-diphosphate delta-isomerase [Ignicoccus islandicus DSM 13165]
METRTRKLDHLRITLLNDVEAGDTWFKYVKLIHRAAPELDLNEVDTRIELFGKTLNAPIIVTGMTGGNEHSAKINATIAEVVEELGLGMGVGSQRAAIEDPSLSWTYRIAREKAPNALLIANIGAPQLLKGYGVTEIKKAIEMIDADAIAIHLNAAQEAFQPEGDVDFKGIIDKVAEIVDELDTPVIIKETGAGIDYETAKAFNEVGIQAFDVSGCGGTSWVKVEMYRAYEKGEEELGLAASWLSDWGIPTAASIMEVRTAAPNSIIIGSGGIRNGMEAAKALALGADVVGVALPALKAAYAGKEELRKFMKAMMIAIKAALFLTSSPNAEEIKGKAVIFGPLKEWIIERGLYEYWLGSNKPKRK